MVAVPFDPWILPASTAHRVNVGAACDAAADGLKRVGAELFREAFELEPGAAVSAFLDDDVRLKLRPYGVGE